MEFARAEQAGDPFAFRFTPQPYLLRTKGGGFQSAEFPWSEALLDDLESLRKPRPDRAIVQRIGELLRRFVTPLGVEAQLDQIVAASRAGKEVCITFRSAAAELYALPWELLADRHSGQAIGSLPGVLFRYEWPESKTLQSTVRSEGGRILFAWSAAQGAVPAKEQIAAIRSACEKESLPFDSESDVIAHASCDKIVSALEKARATSRPVAILHILCHGGEQGTTFGLSLNGEEEGEPEHVDGATLRQLLSPFADMVQLVVLSACDSGNGGALGNQLGSVAQALHRAGFSAVLASRFPLAIRAANQLAETLYEGLVCNSLSVEKALLSVRNRLVRDPALFDWASIQLYARTGDQGDLRPLLFRPYRGLLAFQPEHRAFFFGREREIDQVLTALSSLRSAGKPKFVIVAGASGSGKSSLVLAGVIPKLCGQGPDRFLSASVKPGASPLEVLKQIPERTDRPLLLVIDQLEELFTHVPDPAVRTQFAQKLWLLAQRPDVHIVATLRVDFIGECGELVIDESGLRLDRIAYDDAHRVFVAQLGPKELLATIEQPAARVGIALEAGLTSRMLEAVSGEPGALPLLQHTLDQLWLRREHRTLTQKGYDALGQLGGALSQHAESLFGKLSQEEQRSAQEVMVRLVRLEDGMTRATRQRVLLDKLRPRKKESQARFDGVLRDMTAARLLTIAGEDPNSTVEVAHEALIRSWPRLQNWLKEDQTFLIELGKLEGLLREWKEHHALLVSDQLRFAERLLRTYPERLPEETAQLVRESQREERKIRLIRLTALLVLVCGLIVQSWMFFSEQRAHKRAELARHELINLMSKTSQLPSRAELLRTLARLRLGLELRPDLALVAIAEAQKLEPENPRLLVDQAEYFLAAARFDEVFLPAQMAFEKEADPARKVLSAAIAWSAARLHHRPIEQKAWSERLQNTFHSLPEGVEVPELYATSQLLIENQSLLRQALPIPDVLAVFKLIHSPRTPQREDDLAKRLRVGL